MNSNEKYFEQKFNECSKFLKAKPSDIVSLKYRGFRYHEYYNELLTELDSINGLEIKSIGNVLNGFAYNISYGEQNIIIVEHETGLEILYIAGSIASLVALVVEVWSRINNNRRKSEPDNHFISETQIRYFDKKGNFIEEQITNYLPLEAFFPLNSIKEVELLKKRIYELENIISQLKREANKDKTNK